MIQPKHLSMSSLGSSLLLFALSFLLLAFASFQQPAKAAVKDKWRIEGKVDRDGDGKTDAAGTWIGRDTDDDDKVDTITKIDQEDKNKNGRFDGDETKFDQEKVPGTAKAQVEGTDPESGAKTRIEAEDADGDGKLEKIRETVTDKTGKVVIEKDISRSGIVVRTRSGYPNPSGGCANPARKDEITELRLTDTNRNGKFDEEDETVVTAFVDLDGDGRADVTEVISRKLLRAYKRSGPDPFRPGDSFFDVFFPLNATPDLCAGLDRFPADLFMRDINGDGEFDRFKNFTDPARATFQVEVSNLTPAFVPQFGNGPGINSHMTISNASSTERAEGVVELSDDDGGPLPISFIGLGTRSRLGFTIEPGGKVDFVSDGQGPLAVGSARVFSGTPVGAVVRFNIAGRGIAGVGLRSPARGFIIPVRRVGGINTGVAIQNAGGTSLSVLFILKDKAGVEIARVGGSLAGNGHGAAFVNELFSAVNTDNFEGTLTVVASAGAIVGEALELGSSPGEFTALPVTPLE